MDEIHGAGDHVVAMGTLRIRPLGGGPEASIPTAVLYAFEGGKVVRAEDVALQTAGFDA